MPYIFNSDRVKRAASLFLAFAAIILILRFVIIPKYIFPQKYAEQVEAYAQKYGLEPSLVYAVIKAESNFDTNAVSNKNAKGLMQISEATAIWGASEIGIENFYIEMLYEPEINIEIGCWYIDKLLLQYSGYEDTALAAYNAGSGNVSRWLSDGELSQDGYRLDKIPYNETLKYVKKVDFIKKVYEILY